MNAPPLALGVLSRGLLRRNAQPASPWPAFARGRAPAAPGTPSTPLGIRPERATAESKGTSSPTPRRAGYPGNPNATPRGTTWRSSGSWAAGLLALVSTLLCVPCRGIAQAAEQRLRVVATLTTFADLARTVGGDQVEVSAVASARFNPHFIEPKPSDVLKVKRADLFIHAGLDLEIWRGPLLDAAGNTRLFPGGPGELDLSRGITLLEIPTVPLSRAAGDIHLFGNPHYWLRPTNAKLMAQAIAEKLSELDPAHAQAYRQRAQAFLARVDQKMVEWREQLAPYQGQELVGDHRAWPYLMAFLGLRMEQFLEPKPGIPPTPQQVAFIERYVKERGIRAVVQATYFPRQAAASLARRTGVKIVELCHNVRELPACPDYLALLDYDVQQLVAALRG